MYYTIKHTTRFRYSAPVSESVMEVRMQPRSDGLQRTQRFEIQTTPRANIQFYRDALGNTIHYFDVPGRHSQLTITTEALVETTVPVPLPTALAPDAWQALDQLGSADTLDYMLPSHFARPTELLVALANEFGCLERRDDPLQLALHLNQAMFAGFVYAPNTTTVYSPIDDALRARQGVCQDFAHIMTALLRLVGIPCRYVSGYLYHRSEDNDRSEADASHAWVEALLPGLGWVGLDPTNNLVAGERHVRVAVGRDYDDVPPTRGVFKGTAESQLEVGVRVAPSDAPLPAEEPMPTLGWTPPPTEESDEDQQQQQQQ